MNLPPLAREKAFDAACQMLGKMSRMAGYMPGPPVVIIGTGRTGTNLLESLLRKHDGISMFPGEANELWHPRLEPFDSSPLDIPPIEIDPRHFSEVSAAHWPPRQADRIRDVFAGFHWATGPSRVLVTKSAMLSFMIPQVLTVWPKARFIHLYRFGLAVVESYVKKNHGKYARFSYERDEYRRYCAAYWNACNLEIEEQKQRLSLDTAGRLLEFSYEALCQDTITILGRVAAFLGIDPQGFSVAPDEVSSQNYKTAELKQRPEGVELLDIMAEGLRLRGYVPAAVQA